MPSLMFYAKTNGKKFKYDMKPANLKMDIIGKWLTDALTGKIDPYYKSEDIPEPNDGNVTIVVGKNFEKIVMDETRDAFVMFYDPSCTL